MKKITLSGGFHNSEEVSVLLSDKKYAELKEGISNIQEVLSPSQYKKLDRHFCGIKGCTCGSFMRAKIDF
jgi:hypothetical protein